jgi:hypothetical protein
LVVAFFDGFGEIVDQELRRRGCWGTLTKRNAVVLGSEFFELLPYRQ